jgi:hypothetical protein
MSYVFKVADLKVTHDQTAMLMAGSKTRPTGPYIEVTTLLGNKWFVEVDPKALLPIWQDRP